MPSTNKTSHLRLNQWVRSDGVSMDDFNADNAAVDTALAAVPLLKLADVSLDADGTQLDVDISDYDSDDFMEIRVVAAIILGSAGSVYVRVNDLSNDLYWGGSNCLFDIYQSGNCLEAPPRYFHFKKQGEKLYCVYWGQNCGGYVAPGVGGTSYQPNVIYGANLAASSVTNLDVLRFSVTLDDNMKAGSRVTVYGLK